MNKDDLEYKASWHEHEVNEAFIDWKHWIHALPCLSEEQASMLMTGIDPLIFRNAMTSNRNDSSAPAFTQAQKLLSLMHADSTGSMTPSEWLIWADENHVDVHHQFRIETEQLIDVSKVESTLIVDPAPRPLTSREISELFNGLSWKTEEDGMKRLTNKPVWLRECMVTTGARGVTKATWNPVLVAAQLVLVKGIKPHSVRACFQRNLRLREWLDAWKTYEADNFDTH